jgi:hypothetical protein
MDDLPEKALARIDFARASTNGKKVQFAFTDHDGEQHVFCCPPNAISEIVARLLAAHTHALQNQQLPEQAIVLHKWEIRAGDPRGTLTLALYPSPTAPIPFALSPNDAQLLASDLAGASAKVQPRKPGKQN